MAAPSECSLRLRISLAVIGVFVGLSVGIVFGVLYTNWDTSVWGLLSGIFAAVTLYVHVQYKREVWKIWLYQLKYYMLAGCFGQLAGVVGLAVYLALGITENQVLTAYGRGYYVTCVWCVMTFKWSFALFYYSRSYRRLHEDTYNIPDPSLYRTIADQSA